jgi:hypothetical protein
LLNCERCVLLLLGRDRGVTQHGKHRLPAMPQQACLSTLLVRADRDQPSGTSMPATQQHVRVNAHPITDVAESVGSITCCCGVFRPVFAYYFTLDALGSFSSLPTHRNRPDTSTSFTFVHRVQSAMRAAHEGCVSTGRDGETSLPKSRGREHYGLNPQELSRFAVLGRIPCRRSSFPMEIGKGSYNMCCVNQMPCASPMGRVGGPKEGQNGAATSVDQATTGRTTEFLG